MPTDLVVLSHLRWTWVWQRPQHLISRLARTGAGRPAGRTWFVEEPAGTGVTEPRLRREEHGPVTRVWLEVPAADLAAGGPVMSDPVGGEPTGRQVYFGDPAAGDYPERLARLLGPAPTRTVWLYTPMALDLARALGPDLLVYDMMDDLASFAGAPEGTRARWLEVLREADVVFTGGRSLQRSAVRHRPDATHLFPSGVDAGHYAAARAIRAERKASRGGGRGASRGGPAARPVAGYVGVLDERLDLGLIADLAAALPDWEIRMVGPTAGKAGLTALPRAPNIAYPGARSYDELPGVMAGFDVALMPFALNEATRSISPTKTLEYLAAGLPVVSTRVPDVVADFDAVVDLRDDGAGFAAACREALGHDPSERDASERDARVRPLLARHDWDGIAARMDALLREALAGGRRARRTA